MDFAIRVRAEELVCEFNEAFRCAALPGDGWLEWYTSGHGITAEFTEVPHATVRVVWFTQCTAARAIHNGNK